MKRGHVMPFGAALLPEGGARFRLWAPACRQVELRLEGRDGETNFAMQPRQAGWFEIELPDAKSGDRYRYRLDEDALVPDPASRFQPEGVHGPSELQDPAAFDWPDEAWCARPWEETILYELHLGTFTQEGTYEAAIAKLDRLVELGITAVELMPLAEAPGSRNWGYDGAYPFAPESSYGRPEALKRLIAAAHQRGLMVFLDVVYNHFGPEGNYLHRSAPDFFTERRRTPWGAALDFDGPSSLIVRDFFVQNALYWIAEFNIDGLRLDAVHAIHDDSDRHFLRELAERVRAATPPGREVHLVLENDDNDPRLLERRPDGRPRWYDAQWNDDLHHLLHRLVTGETGGYYDDYRQGPLEHLGRALAEGFDYQGERSVHRGGVARGAPSSHLPPTAFVNFLQNHDQVGNRAFGERIGRLAPPAAVDAALAILLLAPSIPLLFMGEEWDASEPFPFFCDFEPELADAVRQGRRREFERFPEFADAELRARIPDAIAAETFESAVLDWSCRERTGHRDRLRLCCDLLAIRRQEILPRLRGIRGDAGSYATADSELVRVSWKLADGARLELLAAMTPRAGAAPAAAPAGRLLFASDAGSADRTMRRPPWYVAWFLDAEARAT